MRTAALILIAFLPSSLLAGYHDQMSDIPEVHDPELSAQLQDWLNDYAAAYNAQDYEAVLSMWDQTYPTPIYIAEEVDPPMQGWARLNKYFDPIPGVQILDGIRNEYSQVRANYLTDDVVIATYKLRYDIKVMKQKPMSGWDRIMAVFHKTDDGWKLASYTEAPMAPGTMMRKLIEASVPDDFEQWMKDNPPKPPE